MAQVAVLLLAVLGIINAQFLDQPDAGTLFVPVNDQVNLSCSVDVGYYVDWEVRINNGTPMSAARGIHDAIFMEHNFSFTGVGTNTSTLTFGILNEIESQTNNETTITCIAQLGVSARERGNEAQVIFYDVPPSPTDLNVTENELGVFNVSWSLKFIEGVPVNYTLTVLNLNTTSAQPIIIAGLLDQHYMFETRKPCDAYSFTVTAVTAAGNSTPSQEIIFMINMCSPPTLPQMTTTDFETITTSPTTVTTSSPMIAAIVGGTLGSVIAFFGVVILVVALIKLIYKIYCGNDVPSTQHPDRGLSVVPSTIEMTGPPLDAVPKCPPHDQHVSASHHDQDDRNTKGSTSNVNVNFELIKEVDCEGPLGLTTTQEEVLVLERKGIRVLKDLEAIDYIELQQDNMAEITYQQETKNIFVTTSKPCKVFKLNKEEKSEPSNLSLKGENVSPKKFDGLCINNNKLYMCDTEANEILIFNINDENLTIKNTLRRFDTPRDVEIDKNGNIYVAERKRIQVLSQEGSFVQGIGEGQLKNAHALKIVDDTIYVAHKNGASVYSTDGTHVQDIKKPDGVNYVIPFGGITCINDYVYVSSLAADGDKVSIFKKSSSR